MGLAPRDLGMIHSCILYTRNHTPHSRGQTRNHTHRHHTRTPHAPLARAQRLTHPHRHGTITPPSRSHLFPSPSHAPTRRNGLQIPHVRTYYHHARRRRRRHVNCTHYTPFIYSGILRHRRPIHNTSRIPRLTLRFRHFHHPSTTMTPSITLFLHPAIFLTPIYIIIQNKHRIPGHRSTLLRLRT